jgi:hypothetical protein
MEQHLVQLGNQVTQIIHYIKEQFENFHNRLRRLEEAVLILQKQDNALNQRLKIHRRRINDLD